MTDTDTDTDTDTNTDTDEARRASLTRLQEIQRTIDSVGLADHNWAETLLRAPGGVWAQAFQIRTGRAYAPTEPAWVPACDT